MQPIRYSFYHHAQQSADKIRGVSAVPDGFMHSRVPRKWRKKWTYVMYKSSDE
jgi:hypothetical protein